MSQANTDGKYDTMSETRIYCLLLLCVKVIKDKLCPSVGAPFCTIHKRLQFQTAARPGGRYIYIHALLTLFRRRRCDVAGWEKDRQQVSNGPNLGN